MGEMLEFHMENTEERKAIVLDSRTMSDAEKVLYSMGAYTFKAMVFYKRLFYVSLVGNIIQLVVSLTRVGS
ncbi:hypothetical protein UFOVP1528_24 [uncultured Caudovirales phage]|uniref:Uncharacterized protein n=1 Tax=uncultured Caudovirales phage TaxID=2100421 RepID=A0A6J5QUA5_9CAUD|nr:hypothetical protein UFOVP905_3 [uncultured Caudovirales phage]CAB4183134.1 hypothetical protein UFOVP1080_39 [uncultured Caudovirales phage]CAB4197540.1 hypothetical protein UFOVP1321_27 [uncultured Caudovirales phage]CAB4212746.1 hypothetical protein UFOVP1432_36 [uncultured Caudovirales phage]CAB5227296.1 hypothetical protein UFOVP1528_24 [uncultured Caudovirales phage]